MLGRILTRVGGEGKNRRKEALKSRAYQLRWRIKAQEESEGAKFTPVRKEKAEKRL